MSEDFAQKRYADSDRGFGTQDAAHIDGGLIAQLFADQRIGRTARS
jgi:hypothetical protein